MKEHKSPVILLLLRGLTFASFGQIENTWPYVDYDRAELYLYNLDGKYLPRIITREGRLDPSVVGDGKTLQEDHAKLLLGLVNNEDSGLVKSLIIGLTKCYSPHHGIVFYSEADKPLAFMSICFYCTGMRVYPKIPGILDYEEEDDSNWTPEEWINYEQEARSEFNRLKAIIKDLEVPLFEDEGNGYKVLKRQIEQKEK